MCAHIYMHVCYDNSMHSVHKHLQREKPRRSVFVAGRYVNFSLSYSILKIRQMRRLKIDVGRVECGSTRKNYFFLCTSARHLLWGIELRRPHNSRRGLVIGQFRLVSESLVACDRGSMKLSIFHEKV